MTIAGSGRKKRRHGLINKNKIERRNVAKMLRTKLYRLFALATVLVLVLGAAAPKVNAAGTFSLNATTDKAAYYKGEPVVVSVNFGWQLLTQNHTVELALYGTNGTKLRSLANVSVTTENGTYTNTFQLTGDTQNEGTTTYVVKATEGDIILAEDNIEIQVEVPAYRLTVAWSDESDDRKVDPNELVTFTLFIDWTFLNASKNATLYVSVDGKESIIDNIQLSAGSGSSQKTYQTSFEKGEHTIIFSLRDSEDKILVSKSLSFSVGQESRASFTDILGDNIEYIIGAIVFIVLIIAIVYIVKK